MSLNALPTSKAALRVLGATAGRIVIVSPQSSYVNAFLLHCTLSKCLTHPDHQGRIFVCVWFSFDVYVYLVLCMLFVCLCVFVIWFLCCAHVFGFFIVYMYCCCVYLCIWFHAFVFFCYIDQHVLVYVLICLCFSVSMDIF